ncbi:IclR family transcriptional regulator [Halobellus ordinarius]|uniref:IclR family transcriptional regulator n=1 Tax=Halobellus ordinarius TaxID=3075120 RepID=UPI0028808233|nr:IclR family transcriptional regulator [Halobellus sp. ZY16]
MKEKANHPVRTSEKTLALIETLDTADGFRLTELDERLEMSKSGIHNHLSTLREHGYVEKNGDEYSLSLKFLSLGGHVRSRSPLYRHGRSKIDQLASDTGMLANLATEEGGRAVYLYQSRGSYAVSLDTHVGYRLRLHNIGIGKAILAHLSRERVEAIIDEWGLPKATENTITEREELFAELQQIRERGYATDNEERTEGLTCIGAPVQLDGEILGAISISAPTKRLGNAGFDDDITAEVESTAHELALDIKYAEE